MSPKTPDDDIAYTKEEIQARILELQAKELRLNAKQKELRPKPGYENIEPPTPPIPQVQQPTAQAPSFGPSQETIAQQMKQHFNQFIQNHTEEPFMPPKPTEDMISKKIAALEVVKKMKTIQTLSMLGIAGFFIIMIAMMFSPWFGMVAAMIFSGIIIYFVFKNKSEMKGLQAKYGV